MHVLGKMDKQKKACALVLTFSRVCGSQFEITHNHKIIILGDTIIFVTYYTMQQIMYRLKKNHKLQKKLYPIYLKLPLKTVCSKESFVSQIMLQIIENVLI